MVRFCAVLTRRHVLKLYDLLVLCVYGALFFKAPQLVFLRYLFTKHVLKPLGLFLALCVFKAPCFKAPGLVFCAMGL